jgi:hypothetical protein
LTGLRILITQRAADATHTPCVECIVGVWRVARGGEAGSSASSLRPSNTRALLCHCGRPCACMCLCLGLSVEHSGVAPRRSNDMRSLALTPSLPPSPRRPRCTCRAPPCARPRSCPGHPTEVV